MHRAIEILMKQDVLSRAAYHSLAMAQLNEYAKEVDDRFANFFVWASAYGVPAADLFSRDATMQAKAIKSLPGGTKRVPISMLLVSMELYPGDIAELSTAEVTLPPALLAKVLRLASDHDPATSCRVDFTNPLRIYDLPFSYHCCRSPNDDPGKQHPGIFVDGR